MHVEPGVINATFKEQLVMPEMSKEEGQSECRLTEYKSLLVTAPADKMLFFNFERNLRPVSKSGSYLRQSYTG